MNYIHYISSPLVNGSHYGNRGFASPMKELNDQTVLVENGENRNDSYRQRTKYDDRVDSYFSTYDLGILLQNRDSYLEGKLDSNGDVDCYSFSYAQKSFYDKMGIGTKVTVRLENIPEGCEYDLVIYDKQGNQIGIAKDNGDGSRRLPCQIGAGQTVILSGWKTAAVRMQIQIQNSFTASVSQKKDTKNRWKRTGDRNTVVKLKNYTESSMIPSRRMNDIRVWKVWKGYWRKKHPEKSWMSRKKII